MAKGKQAALAATRREEAAHSVIDRLTSELSEAKLRARIAEQRAERLQRVADRVEELEKDKTEDRLLGDALEGLASWRKVAKADGERRKAAFEQLRDQWIPDVITESGLMTYSDAREFILKRYNKIAAAIFAKDGGPSNGKVIRDMRIGPAHRKMDDAEYRRFERLYGIRSTLKWDHDRDASDVFNEMLDAKQAGFKGDDFFDVIGVER